MSKMDIHIQVRYLVLIILVIAAVVSCTVDEELTCWNDAFYEVSTSFSSRVCDHGLKEMSFGNYDCACVPKPRRISWGRSATHSSTKGETSSLIDSIVENVVSSNPSKPRMASIESIESIEDIVTGIAGIVPSSGGNVEGYSYQKEISTYKETGKAPVVKGFESFHDLASGTKKITKFRTRRDLPRANPASTPFACYYQGKDIAKITDFVNQNLAELLGSKSHPCTHVVYSAVEMDATCRLTLTGLSTNEFENLELQAKESSGLRLLLGINQQDLERLLGNYNCLRTSFVPSVTSLLKKLGFDGISLNTNSFSFWNQERFLGLTAGLRIALDRLGANQREGVPYLLTLNNVTPAKSPMSKDDTMTLPGDLTQLNHLIDEYHVSDLKYSGMLQSAGATASKIIRASLI